MSSSADLDGLASAELNVMKKRVEDFQTMATIQSALQEDITKINQLCFKIVSGEHTLFPTRLHSHK